MTNEKKLLYAKAYVELYELIKNLTEEDKSKIPNKFIDFIKDKMDKEYTFKIDKSIGILEQNYSVEAKALIVKLYEKYLAPDEEKEYWKKYDLFCKNKIEEKKKEKYSVNVFNNELKNNITPTEEKEVERKQELLVYKEKSIINIIIEKIISFFNKFR